MPKIVFMRHAKTTLNKEGRFAGRTDCDITEEGAKFASENFQYKDEDFDYFFISPLKRTRQTLDCVIKGPHKEPIIDERIIERDLGEWEGVPYKNFSEALIENYVKGFYDPPKSETIDHVRQRVIEFVEELFLKYNENDRILVITHNGVLRQVRDAFLPNMEKSKIKNAQTLEVDDKDYNEYLSLKNEKSKKNKDRNE